MTTLGYLNPYSGQNFFGFFVVLVQRLYAFLTRQVGFADLTTDEVQMLVLMGVAVSSALVGTFLVLRRMTMLANALSHTILLGIVLTVLLLHGYAMTNEFGHLGINLKAMLVASLATGIVTTFATEFLTKTIGLQEDASTGVVFTTFFALGVVLVTAFTRNAHIGTEVVMGNVDALHRDDIKLVAVILLINLVLIGAILEVRDEAE